VQVAAFFHVAGGGSPPAPVAVALTLAGATPVCIALVGRRLGLTRLTAAVGLTQFLLHTLFSLGSATGHRADHAHDLALALPAGPLTPSPMWQAHAVAAVVTVTALLVGSRALVLAAAGLRLVARRLHVGLVPPEPHPAATTPLPRPVHLTNCAAALLRLRHRGPPVLLS